MAKTFGQRLSSHLSAIFTPPPEKPKGARSTPRLMTTRHSKETGIRITKALAGWRHVDTSGGRNAMVGPTYTTKAELLADHESYMTRAGWIKE